MKKVLFVVLAIAGSLFATNSVEAQQKIGVFDIDIMVQAMPGYRAVDSLVSIYEQDSLRAEYDYNMREYTRLDSTYKKDSAAKKPASVLNYIQTDRNKFGYKLVYWQQYSQQMSEGKRQELAAPMYEKVVNAYSKVLQTNNYLVVLKPGSYEMGSKVENVFEKVAKELKIPLPDQLKSQGPADDQPAPANRPATGTKPATPAKKQ